jgi:FkbM family methyltransferase
MNYIQRQSTLMRDRQISLVLDIGANNGQYGKLLRDIIGYQGRIVSFEPLSDAYGLLKKTAASDPLWECHNNAFGGATADFR